MGRERDRRAMRACGQVYPRAVLPEGEAAERAEAIAERLEALEAALDGEADPRGRPGVEAITATAIEAFGPPLGTVRRGRDLAARLGLAPRQRSTGGEERLGRTPPG